MKKALCALLLTSHPLFAGEIIVSRSEFIEQMKTVLPHSLCAENLIFRECFKVTEDECIREALRATKTCLMSMENEMPEKLRQPQDGVKWGEKIGTCIGNNYVIRLKDKQVNSKKCDQLLSDS